MNTITETQSGELCFTLNTMWPPLSLGDDVRVVLNTVVQSLDTKYGKRAFACVRGSKIEIDISNDYIEHIDTCRSACMAAFEALGRNQEGYVSACHENCRKMVRMAAFESLDDTLAELEEELERLGVRYTSEYDREEFPQHLRVVVWL